MEYSMPILAVGTALTSFDNHSTFGSFDLWTLCPLKLRSRDTFWTFQPLAINLLKSALHIFIC